MDRASTVSDIARIAGCAPTTVSRYLNKSGYVGEKTADRIREAIEQLEYRPNFLARSLRSRVNRTIFMAVPNIENPFFASFYKVVQSFAHSHGYFLIAYDTGAVAADEFRALSSAAELNVCGIILFSDNFTVDLHAELERIHIPAVVNDYEACGFDSVHGERNRSAYIATRHLLDCGHRRIGFVGGSRNTRIEKSRLGGFHQAMSEACVSCRDEYMVEGQFTIEAGKSAGMHYCGLEILPTAVCCANDLLALGLITCFHERGIRVPHDVSVVGIDNIIYDEACFPPLTSVTSDPEVMAEKAFAMLYSRISGDYAGPPRDVIVEHRLVIRGSTQCR